MPGIVNSENFYDFDLSEVEVIFSTWGMICFSAEQLAGMPNLKAVFYAAGATDACFRFVFHILREFKLPGLYNLKRRRIV